LTPTTCPCRTQLAARSGTTTPGWAWATAQRLAPAWRMRAPCWPWGMLLPRPLPPLPPHCPPAPAPVLPALPPPQPLPPLLQPLPPLLQPLPPLRQHPQPQLPLPLLRRSRSPRLRQPPPPLPPLLAPLRWLPSLMTTKRTCLPCPRLPSQRPLCPRRPSQQQQQQPLQQRPRQRPRSPRQTLAQRSWLCWWPGARPAPALALLPLQQSPLLVCPLLPLPLPLLQALLPLLLLLHPPPSPLPSRACLTTMTMTAACLAPPPPLLQLLRHGHPRWGA
jgi:hypothetical protein